MKKETREPVCYVTVPVYACTHKPEPTDEPGKSSIGHLHLGVASGTITNSKGETVGAVSVDPACTLILKVYGENYHISATPVWEALQAQLGYPEKVEVAQ